MLWNVVRYVMKWHDMLWNAVRAKTLNITCRYAFHKLWLWIKRTELSVAFHRTWIWIAQLDGFSLPVPQSGKFKTQKNLHSISQHLHIDYSIVYIYYSVVTSCNFRWKPMVALNFIWFYRFGAWLLAASKRFFNSCRHFPASFPPGPGSERNVELVDFA